MPQIRPYTQQLAPDASIPSRQAEGSDFGGPGVSNLGRAIQSAGQDASYVQHFIQQNDTRQAVTDVHTFLLDTQAKFLDKARQYEQEADPSKPNLGKKFLTGDGDETDPESLKGYLDAYGEQIQNPTARLTYQEGAARLSEQFVQHFVGVESKMAAVYAKQQHTRALDAAQTIVQTDPSQYTNVRGALLASIDDRNGIYGRLSAEQREPLKRLTEEQVASSTVRGMIQDSPQHALHSLDKGEWDGTLSGEQKIALQSAANTAIHANEVEAERILKHQDTMQKKQVETIHATLVEKDRAHQSDPGNPKFPPLSAKDPGLQQLIQMDPKLGSSILNGIQTDSRTNASKPIRTNSAVEQDLLNRMTAKPGDKYWDRRLTDPSPIYEAYANGLTNPNRALSRETRDALLKDWEQGRSPEGHNWIKERSTFFDGIKQAILKPGPMGVWSDPSNGLKLSQAKQDFDAEVARYRKDGKDFRQLTNPENPQEYFWRPSNRAKYVATGFGSLEEEAGVVPAPTSTTPKRPLSEIMGMPGK